MSGIHEGAAGRALRGGAAATLSLGNFTGGAKQAAAHNILRRAVIPCPRWGNSAGSGGGAGLSSGERRVSEPDAIRPEALT